MAHNRRNNNPKSTLDPDFNSNSTYETMNRHNTAINEADSLNDNLNQPLI